MTNPSAFPCSAVSCFGAEEAGLPPAAGVFEVSDSVAGFPAEAGPVSGALPVASADLPDPSAGEGAVSGALPVAPADLPEASVCA